MPEELLWEQILARTNDNLAAAREIMKDAGTVTRWSQRITENVRQGRAARQSQREQRQAERETRQAEREEQPEEEQPEEEQPVGRVSEQSVLVVRLERGFDLFSSPSLQRLLLDLAAAADLRAGDVDLQASLAAAADLLAGEEPQLLEDLQAVVVDLRGVDLMDMSGVACLIAGHRALARSGPRLMVLLAPESQPQRVFAARSLGRIIPAFGSLDEM